jgi:TP901 family phage tail tape measure protein
LASFKGYKRTIQVDFDYAKVKDGVPKVTQQMALLNAEFNKASAQVAATGNSFDRLVIQQQKLGAQTQLQKDKVAQLEKELAKLTSADTKNEKAIASKTIALKNAQAQLTRLETQQRAVNAEVAKSSTIMGMAKLEMENFRLGAERSGVNLGKLKADFIATTLAIAAFATVTTRAFLTFDNEMIKSRTIMDETQVSYKQMSKDVLDMSSKYGIAADTMANANYEIISSNVETSKANIVLEQSAKLAKTGFTDVAVAADILTSVMNGYGKSAEESAAIVDTFIITQKVGKLTVGELAASMGDLISVSASAKVPLEQIEAAIATMTLSGVKADTAITNVRQIVSALISPTAEAASAAKELGIQFNAAALERKGFAGFMEDVMRKTGGSTEAIGALFGNIRSLSGMLNLTKDGGQKFAEVLDQIKNSGGATDEALALLGETSGAKLNKSLNDLKISLIEMGDAISPIVDLLSKLAGFIAAIPAPVLLGVVAFASMAKILGLLSTALIALGAGSGIAASGLGALGLAGGISLPVILGIAAAVALVVGLLVLLTRGSNEASAALKKVGSDSANVASQVQQQTVKLQSVVKQSAAKTTTIGKSYSDMRGYATGTNYVPEDGVYDVHANERLYLPKSTRITNPRETAQDNANNMVDMSDTNNLLGALIGETRELRSAFKDWPRQQSLREATR